MGLEPSPFGPRDGFLNGLWRDEADGGFCSVFLLISKKLRSPQGYTKNFIPLFDRKFHACTEGVSRNFSI